MKTPGQIALLTLRSLGVIPGMAHLFWPGGLAAPPAAPPRAGAGADPARGQAAAEANSPEAAWLDATRYAAEAGIRRKLPFLAKAAVDTAIAGGPVEARLKRTLTMAGSRTAALTFAMRAQGLLEPADPVGRPAGKP